jgi:formylglycine-generating enzyme required for sulfatase activity
MKQLFCLSLLCCMGLCSSLMANNIAVSIASLTGQNTTAGTNSTANFTMVKFNVSWDNSWRTSSGPSNWDAAWVFVKFMVGSSNPVLTGASSSGTTVTVSSTANLRAGMPVVVSSGTGTFATNTVISSISSATQFEVSATPSTALSNATITCQRIWEHASLDPDVNSHIAPNGSTILVPADSTGAFIYRSADGTGSVNYQNVQLRWQYGINGVTDDALIQVKVFAIEMVYVPQGAFAAGGGTNSPPQFWYGFLLTTINTANATTVPSGNAGISSSPQGGYPSGITTPTNALWPNGFGAFYCMKYEITQGAYRDFLNTLTYAQQVSRTATAPSSAAGTGALESTNANRNGLDIMTSGVAATFTPAVYACNLDGDGIYDENVDGEWIACNWLTWMDGCAYVDWAGLRPMTELEYEKACRGTLTPVANERAWGSTALTRVTAITNDGANNETYTDNGANAVCSSGVAGPLRVGVFAGASTTRAQAGATYYGIMEMTGNVWERAVTIYNLTGTAYTGVHGNGRLSTSGHANQTNWPGLSGGEVTGATGSGARGGGFTSLNQYLRMIDRNNAHNELTTREPTYGFRGVR